MTAGKIKWGLAVSWLVAILPLPAIAQEPASCAKPGLALEPIYKTHTLVPYPAESQRRRERGIAIFLVSIGTDGVPANVAITRSGASQTLNDGAIEYIISHWRWQPPMRDCQPTTAEMPVTVIWDEMNSAIPEPDFHVKMPASAYPPGASERVEDGSTLLEIETDEQGVATGGRVIHSSGFSDLDNQALAVVKNSPALLKGQAAGKHVLSADWSPPREMFPPYGETMIVTGREPR